MQGVLDLVLDVALSPALWMCVLFGLVYAVLFTLWHGGGLGQAVRDIVTGIVGFGTGQAVVSFVHLPSLRVGEVHLLWGSLFCVFALLVGRRYWKPRRRTAADGLAAGVRSSGAPNP